MWLHSRGLFGEEAQWWQPAGLPPPAAQYQSCAEGSYRPGDAPPTVGIPLSPHTQPGQDHRTTHSNRTNPFLQSRIHKPSAVYRNLADSNHVKGLCVQTQIKCVSWDCTQWEFTRQHLELQASQTVLGQSSAPATGSVCLSVVSCALVVSLKTTQS